ncbi:MAG: tryptophan-rich sensory protein [Chlorobium sp.]|nr:MAG: tryptophan-rich sensory protein [Chlorobium sp.]
MATWYDELKKPPFTPPKNIFGPVWTLLYIFIIASLFFYFFSPVKPHPWLTGFILAVHFTASFSWTTLFFKKRKILPALIDLLLIDITLVFIIVLFSQASTISALLLIPYFCWGLFAAYLNLGIYRLNR